MTQPTRSHLPQNVLGALGSVRRRVRLQRALDAFGPSGVAGLVIAALGLGAGKSGLAEAPLATGLVASGLALPLLGLAFGALRRIPRLHAAQLLDRSHDLRSRLTTALELVQLPEKTPFMEAAIADAVARAEAGLDPARAMPLRRPQELPAIAVLTLLVGLLAAFEVRAAIPPPPPASTAEVLPLLVDPDALEAFQSRIDPVLGDRETTDDVREVAHELNELLEQLADRELERTDALRELQNLEAQLVGGDPAHEEAFRDAIRDMGRELARSEITEAAGEALQEDHPRDAAQEMQRIGEQMELQTPSRRELDRLRDALRRAAEDRDERRERELQREEERLQSLLNRQREQQEPEEREQRLLRRRQRELERLQRERQNIAEQRRRLDRLRREFEQAAENLNRNASNQERSEAMRRLAEQLNRRAREQMSEEQRQQLQRQIEQLREAIRRMQQQGQNGQGQNGQGQNGQGQNGQGRQGRMRRFVLRAGGGEGSARLRIPGQGQQGQGQQGQGQGQQGQGQGQQGQGQGQQGQNGQGQGQNGQGQNGQGGQGGQSGGQQGGQGQNGQGQGGEQFELRPGRGGQGDAILEMPGMGGGQQGEGQGQGGDPGGASAGNDHDPNMLGEDPTRLNSRHQTSTVQGQHSAGPTRSQVILGAAERGFANEPYREVYTDYEDHAEEVLERDEVPPGYRFYVRRYFQLIRPRDDAASDPPSEAPAGSEGDS